MTAPGAGTGRVVRSPDVTAAPRRRWRAGVASMIGALWIVACSSPNVSTRSAERIGGPATAPENAAPPATTTGDPAPPLPETSPAPPGPDETRPEFTLPDLTFPESTPPGTTVSGGDDDLASAGDDLYPELGNDAIDVQHYVVQIDYDPAETVISGTVTVTLAARQDLEQIVLDAAEMTINTVRTDDGEPPWFKSDDELVIEAPLAEGEVVDVAVAYEDAPSSDRGAFGLDAGWFATEGGSYVLNEPDALRSWMPAHDHPSDKATWRFEITVPEGLTGVANGELVEERPGEGTTTWIWLEDEPMSTYLVQLLTGDYAVVDGGAAGSVPLVNVALTGDVERMQPYFDLTDDQMSFFEQLFGPYPLARYGLAFSESFAGLAMETQGRSLFSRDDFPGGEPDHLQHLFLSHELAHQWFGNAVSPAGWDDLWLNESFATYGEWLWMDHAGFTDLERDAQDALQIRNEISAESTGAPSVDNLFGFERYGGGAVVLHALRNELGDDELFFGLLQRWVTENVGTSRSTEDFIALAEDVAGRALGAFFDDWLFATTLPAEYPT